MEEVGRAEESANLGLITAIVAVATLGGFLFGFDSGVINGTVDGLRAAFHMLKARYGER